MTITSACSRRSLLGGAFAATISTMFSPAARRAVAAAKRRNVPVGIEMFSLREEERKDMPGTLKLVKEMGYDGVEFWAPYLDWSREQTKDLRKVLDDNGLKCFSTHNRTTYFQPDKLGRAIDYNLILGSRYIVNAYAGDIKGIEAWTKLIALLNDAHKEAKKSGLKAGHHNWGLEWRTSLDGGKRPIDLLMAETPKDFGYQLDTATCLAEGGDPTAFIKANPGRVKSYHLKDWSNDKSKGYRVLLGEGIGDFPRIIDAAEAIGGVEFYLIEQEGSRLTPVETAKACLENYRKFRASLG